MEKDRILVVDDDPDNRAMIGHFLTNWGYLVEDAKDGRAALDQISANPPALVLLDLEMPEMDGFETCERLKTNPDTEWIPVIIFTGLEKMPHRIRGFRQGADDYIVKTVEPDELRSRIDLVLQRTRRYATLASSPVPLEEEPLDPEPREGSGPVAGPSLSLSKTSFPEAMRRVLAEERDGVAHLTNGERRGSVHVRAGSVIHASTAEQEGLEAFYELALWKAGRFEFEETDPGDERTIATSTRTLLLEASRRFDAWSTISTKVKSFDWIPKPAPMAASSIRLTSSDWAIVRLVDGRRSIREIVDELNTDLFEAGRIAYGLLTVGLLRLDEAPDAGDAALDLVPRRGETIRTSDPFELNASEWDLLCRIGAGRTLGAIRDSMSLPLPEFLKMVRALEDKGFLVLSGRATRGDPAP